MNIVVREESAASLAHYATVPISFAVTEVLDVDLVERRSPDLERCVRAAGRAYVKDYDSLDGGPLAWAERFDLSSWVLLGAYVEDERVGSAALAGDASSFPVAEHEANAAVLWDIRVSPRFRGRGVGKALLAGVERCALARGFRRLVVETQNVNVPACRFYLRHGFALGAVHPFAYPPLPDEVQLLWHKVIDAT